MTNARDKSVVVPSSSNSKHKQGVHWIHARHAMEDRESWRVAALVRMGRDSVNVRFEDDSTSARFTCRNAPELKIASASETSQREKYPSVVIVERWPVMIVPVGKDGSQPPRRIAFVALEGGVATKALTDDPGDELLLFSIAREVKA